MITNTSSEEEKTELLYGVEAAVGKGVWFMKNVKIGMDLFGEKNGPSIIIEWAENNTDGKGASFSFSLPLD
jgi:hypothetical protein